MRSPDASLASALRAATLLLLAPGPVLATDFNCTMPADSSEKGNSEVKEALSSAQSRPSDLEEMQAWLETLVGRHAVEGYLGLCRKDKSPDLQSVTGIADCIAADTSRSVHCKVDLSLFSQGKEVNSAFRDDVATPGPAQILLSIVKNDRAIKRGQAPDNWSLLVMQVNSAGVADWASGELRGDTFTSRERCLDGRRSCYRATRFTSRPDNQEISLQVDTEVSGRRVQSQRLLLRRIGPSEK